MRKITVTSEGIGWEDLAWIARGGRAELALSPEASARIAGSRAHVAAILATGKSVYGVNTGFGKLAKVRIDAGELATLQRNLLLSHATALGDPMTEAQTRTALVLRIANLARGHSGVRPVLVERLVRLFNLDLLAVVPQQGSVGACGDLAPLAHLALPVIGEGDVRIEGRTVPARVALAAHGLAPLVLEAKEGLALINGTQVSLAFLVEALARAENLVVLADIAGAMSAEGLLGTDAAFDARLVALRPHPGARRAAENLMRLFAGSAIRDSHRDCDRVQDPYSIRCMPQVHGASRDALAHVLEVAQREAAAVTDNPLVLDDGSVLSAGNFHGQPLALAADYAAIALAELASISSCRIEQLVNPDLSGLPPFLVQGSGLNSGLMIAQVAAVSLVSENKVLAHPASVDSLPTSAEQEDHVSMSTFAARKLLTVAANLEKVLAIEILAASQAIDYRAPLRSSPALAAVHACVREGVAFFEQDRYMKPAVEAVLERVRDGRLVAAAAAHVALFGIGDATP